ncbi:MAG: TonB family protein [Melioribacteraceae bacterium]|nr:TonB family protein [Melioribacteraceae bacterium]
MMKRLLLLIVVVIGLFACTTGSRIIPRLEREPKLIYPVEAIEKQIEGNVELLLLVNCEGNVKDVRIKNSSGYRSLDEAALKYGRRLKYFPITEITTGGEVWIDTKVIFVLDRNEKVESSYVGKVWESEKETWTDPEFGHEITKWTSEEFESWHLYFNVESFIDENNLIIYSTRAGGINLFRLNLLDGTIKQFTYHKGRVGSVWHIPELKKVWYEIENSIRELNYETMEDKLVFSDDKVDIRAFTVTCDSKYLINSINKNPGWSKDNSTGPYAIMRYDFEKKEVKQISPDYGFTINHLQASPTDPNLVIYAWQHQYREDGAGIVGNTPIRIWWLNVNGNDGGPVIPQEFGLHRTHEFWLYDGSRIGYSARYMFGPNQGKQFLGSCKYDGSDNFMFDAPVGPAHSQIYKDNKHWVADQNDGMILTLWTFERDKVLKEEKLFRHNSSWDGQPGHPHPHFSPDGKYIVFGTDMSGSPQVYTVKINLDKK